MRPRATHEMLYDPVIPRESVVDGQRVRLRGGEAIVDSHDRKRTPKPQWGKLRSMRREEGPRGKVDEDRGRGGGV